MNSLSFESFEDANNSDKASQLMRSQSCNSNNNINYTNNVRQSNREEYQQLSDVEEE